MQVKTKKVARLARRMGVRTPVSSNLAMALGGLRQGVTPLDMAHAYETFATGGKLIYGSLSPGQSDEVAARARPGRDRADRPEAQGQVARGRARRRREDGQQAQGRKRVLDAGDRRPGLRRCCRPWSSSGTATRAQIPGVMVAGKTGTTENYGDAWFVAWTKEYTVAVWVGYPDEFKPMKTEFQGEPVAGGTYPGGDLEDLHAVAAEDRPAAQEGRRRRDRQGPRADPDARHRHRAAGRDDRARRHARRRRRPTAADGSRPRSSRRPSSRPAEQPPAEEPPAEQPPATDPGTGGGEAAPPADGTG